MTQFQQQFTLLTRRMLTLERLWELARFQPNDQQRQAILHVDGPLYLTAGPGSGKTRVLLWRTVNLIAFHEVKPEEIFLSTFTEKAAHQLKEGLRVLLGLVTNLNGQPYDLSSMYIGTVHSLCQRMLSDRRRFQVDPHRNRPPQLLDELGQYFHLARNRNWTAITQQADLAEEANAVVNTIMDNNSQSKHAAVVNALSIFNRFSEECIDPQNTLHLLERDEQSIRDHYRRFRLEPEQVTTLIRLYAAYRESLQVSPVARLTDFALMQQEASRILEQYADSGHVFKHVIVDEYQDTNTIQERIFFSLAAGNTNICVVGDDDQALYRFRGATVENFVEFPARCQRYLGINPRRISLDTNYRSRTTIVDFYSEFMRQSDWSKPDGQGAFRVADKDIRAHRGDAQPAVVASTPAKPDDVCGEIAQLVRRLLDEGKVDNPNQIAFLFPSLKYRGDMVKAVERMKAALEAVGLQVYAPRAGRFLEVDESYDVFGLLLAIVGRPPRGEFPGHDYSQFMNWFDQVDAKAEELMSQDPSLRRFVEERKAEIERVRSDYQILTSIIERNRWDPSAPYRLESMKRPLHSAAGISNQARKLLASVYFDRLVQTRLAEDKPLSLSYVIKRATSLDWNLLDLFYRLCGFRHFKHMFDLAETNGDEGPVANLGLISQYIARFVDERIPLISADLLVEPILQRVFFSYLYALFRLGETELENADDPFPKGRIPFLTIHQSKGLEFPVVVLGNLRKENRGPSRIEQITRPLLEREPGEPLERMTEFDIMRMFYVALSRAENLLVLAHYRGSGQRINDAFQAFLDDDFPRIPELDLDTVPAAGRAGATLPRTYSFTSDFLMYRKCPRQYMIFNKYGFVPSRSQTMFFGSLVHRTLEDLHHELIHRRSQS